jgi:hypothetical protein
MNATDVIERGKRLIEEHVVASRSREEHAEIHTPPELIQHMLDNIPDEKFEDPEATFADFSAGLGNFPLHIAERLVENDMSYSHVMENQIYMVEIQPKNCIKIEEVLNPTGNLNLNLKCCDALKLDVKHMKPEDWKTERFRTDYSNAYKFFERTTPDEEYEKLNQIRNLTNDQQIIGQFERGY